MPAITPLREHPVAETARLELPQGEIPLGFVQEGDRIFLIARERSALWPVTILRAGKARLQLPQAQVAGETRLVSQASEKEWVLGLFRTKYGPERYRKWYDRPARVLEVRLTEKMGSTEDPDRYNRWLEAEFDNVANDYDHHITGNRINRLLRDRSLLELRSTFHGAHRLLEIGCGSGMETLHLLREGHEMVCVDISSQMLRVVEEKARVEGLSERLSTRKLALADLEKVLPDLGEGALDGAYSTYGALNCEPDLSRLPGTLHQLLRPRGHFVAGVYNRWCLFESFGYLLTLQGARAFGRRNRPVPVGTSRFCVDVYAHTPMDFLRLFSGTFRPLRLEGIPVILPPSDLVVYAEKLSRNFDVLSRWDARLGPRWPWKYLGDHFLLTLERT